MPDNPDDILSGGLVPSDPNRTALADPRVKSFLDKISKSEGADYNTLVGGRRISDLSQHPNVVGLTTSAGPSTAFGRYQITGTTNRSKLAKYANLDYSPGNQDLRAVELLRQTKALDALQADDEPTAIKRAGREWASLPGSSLPGRKNLRAFAATQQDPILSGGLVAKPQTQTAQSEATDILSGGLVEPQPIAPAQGRGAAMNVAPQARREPQPGNGEQLARDIDWHFGSATLDAFHLLPTDQQQSIARKATQLRIQDEAKRKRGEPLVRSEDWQLQNRQKLGLDKAGPVRDELISQLTRSNLAAQQTPEAQAARFHQQGQEFANLPWWERGAITGATGMAEAGGGLARLAGKVGVPGAADLGQATEAMSRDIRGRQAEAAKIKSPGLLEKAEEGLISYAPLALGAAPESALARIAAGAGTFGAYSGAQAYGRGESAGESLKEGAKAAPLGALLGVPKSLVPFGGSLVKGATTTLAKAPVLYGLARAEGATHEQALEQTALLTGFQIPELIGAGVGKESPKVEAPMQTVPEAMQGRIRLGDIKEQARQAGATVLNPDEVIAGGKPKVRLREGANESTNVRVPPEQPSGAGLPLAQERNLGKDDLSQRPSSATAVSAPSQETAAQDRATAAPGVENIPANVERSRSRATLRDSEPARSDEATAAQPSSGTVVERGRLDGVSTEPPRHVDLQPRRQRGDGKGQFKEETTAQAEARRAQVNPAPAIESPQPIETKPSEPTEPKDSNVGISKLAKGVEAKAIEAKLTEGFGSLPEYSKVQVADQANRAAELLKSDPAKASRIALGEEPPPNGLLPESVFVAVENQALKHGDVNLIRDLAIRSSLSTEATGMGQRIRMLAERNPNSAVSVIRDVQTARQARATKEFGDPAKARIEIQNQIKAEIQKAAPKIRDWHSFLESIQC